LRSSPRFVLGPRGFILGSPLARELIGF